MTFKLAADLSDDLAVAEGEIKDVSIVTFHSLAALAKSGLYEVKFGGVILYQSLYLQCVNRQTVHDEQGIHTTFTFVPYASNTPLVVPARESFSS